VVRSMCRKRQSASVQRASTKNVPQIAATIAKWRLRHGFVGTHKVCKRHASLITLCALALLAVSGYSRVGAREGYIFYSGVCPHTILRCVALAFAYCFFQKKTRVASLQCPRRLGRGIGLSHNQLRKILRRRTLQRTRHHNGLQSGPIGGVKRSCEPLGRISRVLRTYKSHDRTRKTKTRRFTVFAARALHEHA